MKNDDKNKKQSPYPPRNVSVNYYTDPIYSTDAFYGYEDNNDLERTSGEDAADDAAGEAAVDDENKALDEPVESWGWINNVD